MKHSYILIQKSGYTDAIMGVFESGKKLADAASGLKGDYLVKTVPMNMLDTRQHAGFDHQGTRLAEFLACPVAKDDTGV